MNPTPSHVDFGQCLQELGLPELGLPELGLQKPNHSVTDVQQATMQALAQPIDFPPLAMAVVEGDRIAVAVDPNVPQVVDLVVAVVRSLQATSAEHVDVVLGDEATETTLANLRAALRDWLTDDYVTLVRHDSSDREALRYLGAGADALPWYVSRPLVDADVVLPIALRRLGDLDQSHDITGIYPAFADSATRRRVGDRTEPTPSTPTDDSPETQIPALIGIQLMIAVSANHVGGIGEIVAGTPFGIAHEPVRSVAEEAECPLACDLVIASLDGDAQQQSWPNVARAAWAASRYAKSGGTILVWTAIDQPPSVAIIRAFGSDDVDFLGDAHAEADESQSEAFPPWDASVTSGNLLARVAAEHRIVIRSQVAAETMEPLGMGALQTIAELRRLMETFPSCGVLRGAQFAIHA